jgi:Mg-chelatase subunit ChlD
MKTLSLLFIAFALLSMQERVVSQALCPAALDLVFIVDASGSIGIDSYNEAKTAMKAMVLKYSE